MTQYVSVDPARPDPEVVACAARIIREGGLVAFPTETVYGLGANAFDPAAVAGVFRAKGRPSDNPLIVHIAGTNDLEIAARAVPEKARKLGASFWPGPLTMVLLASPGVPRVTSGGLATVAVRVPAHPVATALIRASGTPVAAPSANRSGRPSPTNARHVLEDLDGRIDMILDGGPCTVGVESSVIDLTGDPPVLLRPGGLSRSSIEAVIGDIRTLEQAPEAANRSPGTRYRHYAPKARVILAGPGEVAREVARHLSDGRRVGVMAVHPVPGGRAGLSVRMMSADPAGYARELFAALREMDDLNCEVIVAETVDERGLGSAVMDRLRRASQGDSAGTSQGS